MGIRVFQLIFILLHRIYHPSVCQYLEFNKRKRKEKKKKRKLLKWSLQVEIHESSGKYVVITMVRKVSKLWVWGSLYHICRLPSKCICLWGLGIVLFLYRYSLSQMSLYMLLYVGIEAIAQSSPVRLEPGPMVLFQTVHNYVIHVYLL